MAVTIDSDITRLADEYGVRGSAGLRANAGLLPSYGVGGGATPTAAQSTLTGDAGTFTGNASDDLTFTYTPKDASGSTLTGQAWVATVARVLLSAGNSSVSATGTIADDGVDSCTVSVSVLDADGYPAPNVAVTIAVTGTGNTVTQPASRTNASGIATGSFVSTGAATKTVSATVNGLSITDTASVIVTGGSITYPNEPSGYTRFVETDYSAKPAASLPTDGGGFFLADPVGNLTLETSPTRMRYHFPTGTPAGYSPLNYAIFGMWDTDQYLSGTEYSEVYFYHQVKLVGVGGTFETPTVGFKFIGYGGVALNNQNGSGAGPVQWYNFARPVSYDGSSPARASEFYWDIRTQMTGSSPGNRDLPQNLNTGTHVVVGTDHVLEINLKLNTPGSANGEAHWWIDGVKVGEYTDVRWIDSSYANAGYGAKADGLAGFFGTYMDCVWGGSGGAAKTRDDPVDWTKTYISGVFLRAANP